MPNNSPTNNDVGAAPPGIDLIIRWTPSTGQIQIAWPAVDDTVKLGMLEMAKASLIEARVKAQNQGQVAVVGAMPGLRSH